jgi:ribosomal protein RSM22 (predicted rRNA methylase)
MKRIPLQLSDEYIAALAERLGFDLSPKNLATRAGKAYIAEKAALVSEISQGLTKSRETFLASEYLKGKNIREAYLLYYMSTNMLKVIQPLRELALSDFFDRESLRVLDLGTGTGAAMWGLLNYLEQQDIAVDLTLTDSLEENLVEAKKFLGYLRPQGSTLASFEKFDLRKLTEIPKNISARAPYQLITMMNVLNELDEANDGKLLNTLTSLLDEHGSIMMIEPATRLESRRLLRFRDRAIKHTMTVYSPCTMQDDCPAMIKEDDWCHSEIDWDRPPFIKVIDDLTGTLRLSLKYTYIILRNDEVTLSHAIDQNDLFRVVSKRFDEKGRVRAFLCGEPGRHEYILNKRDRSETNADFAEIERYDLVKVAEVEIREHDRRIPELSPFSLVLPNCGSTIVTK